MNEEMNMNLKVLQGSTWFLNISATEENTELGILILSKKCKNYPTIS